MFENFNEIPVGLDLVAMPFLNISAPGLNSLDGIGGGWLCGREAIFPCDIKIFARECYLHEKTLYKINRNCKQYIYK